MRRNAFILTSASLFAALTLASVAHAETVQLSNNCSFETDCSAECNSGSINCSAQYVDTCSKSCTETVSDSCSKSCETQCTTTPASFSCTDYCNGQCESTCAANNNCGAASSTDCVTDCQGQCSYSCSETSASTSCSTECNTSCQAVENINCSVSCQAKASESCSITPASCSASCSGTGGVILCNGQVVYVADNIADAASWYVGHLDAQFSLSLSSSCTGDQCTTTLNTSGCSIGSSSNSAGNWGFLSGGSLLAVAAIRRRKASLRPNS